MPHAPQSVATPYFIAITNRCLINDTNSNAFLYLPWSQCHSAGSWWHFHSQTRFQPGSLWAMPAYIQSGYTSPRGVILYFLMTFLHPITGLPHLWWITFQLWESVFCGDFIVMVCTINLPEGLCSVACSLVSLFNFRLWLLKTTLRAWNWTYNRLDMQMYKEVRSKQKQK